MLAATYLVLADRHSDVSLAREALRMLCEAETVLRRGGHATNADNLSRRIPDAEALMARLAGPPEGSP
jgi:hypothetical protein